MRWVYFTLVLTVGAATTLSGAGRRHGDAALPLGPKHLVETRTSQPVTPGVIYTRIVRGEESAADYYTVFIFRPTIAEARDLARRLRADGYQASVERIADRAFDDPTLGPLGWRVTVGQFRTLDEVNAQRDALAAAGYTLLRVVYTGEDGKSTSGPWVVHVLEIDPHQFRGDVVPALGTGLVPGNQPLTGIAAATGALAAINGGYFVIGATDGTPGDLAGISMLDGDLVSEAVNGRTSLVLPTKNGRYAAVAALSTRVFVHADSGARRRVDGLNRKPGLIRGCGGIGDAPTDTPKHDFTCTDVGELILYKPIFGAGTEPGAGIEVALAADGIVLDVRATRGGDIPPEGAVLAGTGDGADWLQRHILPGSRVEISTQLFADGSRVTLGPEAGIVNGGPRLLRRGVPQITAAAEGFHWPENPEFYYRFGERRNPRTLAGVTAGGKLLLVAVDGRQPGYSVGASFDESAQIMRALGAVEAVNLDGGGSTTLTIDGQLANRPSDATGERPIADAIVIKP